MHAFHTVKSFFSLPVPEIESLRTNGKFSLIVKVHQELIYSLFITSMWKNETSKQYWQVTSGMWNNAIFVRLNPWNIYSRRIICKHNYSLKWNILCMLTYIVFALLVEAAQQIWGEKWTTLFSVKLSLNHILIVSMHAPWNGFSSVIMKLVCFPA